MLLSSFMWKTKPRTSGAMIDLKVISFQTINIFSNCCSNKHILVEAGILLISNSMDLNE